MEVDHWEESVLEYVEGKDRVTTKAIMVEQFQWENPALWTQANSKRLGAILRRMAGSISPIATSRDVWSRGLSVVTDSPVTQPRPVTRK